MAPTAPAPPSAIGPYTILETLDARAFTVTYRAEQPGLGRTVVLKTLRSTVSVGSPFAAALAREADVLGRLDHEGIVRLYDLVRTEDALYAVLEDARGVSLADVLRATRVEPASAVAIALAAARALGHAHGRGVVHRALSAAAVAITPEGRVLLTDFSAAARASDAGEARIEMADELGEPSYMAPEQILGEPSDARSDVWALGALLHELVAGARPFDAGDPKKLAHRIRNDAPATLPPRAPPGVARVVARCLSKAPDDRYADASIVAAALDDALLALSRLPSPVLASRALAAAKLGEALPAPTGVPPAEERAHADAVGVARAARSFAVVLAAILAGGAALRALDDGDEGGVVDGVAEGAPIAANARDRGFVRVVARPWAEVYVDGDLVDVTPVGRPIPVTPGKHFVTFRHPSAPDEQRAIRVGAGQTVLLDVTLRVDRGDAGLGHADGGAPAGGSP